MKSRGLLAAPAGHNLLDGGARFYNVYQCADQRWLAVGALEEEFYRQFLIVLGLKNDPDFIDQWNQDKWPILQNRIANLFASQSIDHWLKLFEDHDACCCAVLEMDEAQKHPHHIARGTFFESEGAVQPSPAPRFSVTALPIPRSPSAGSGPRGNSKGVGYFQIVPADSFSKGPTETGSFENA
jgi:alpha-methylacyl-CoA racemase